ncbi:MAG: translation initiation factor IF-6 [Methanobacteriota archaeon]|nr:MAG: translation initiation factor IF-6 [Euryarchaeota archaeon]
MIRRLDIAGNPYVGVFCAANDELAVVASDVPKSAVRHIEGALETRAVITRIGHSTVVGSLLAMNSKGILASPFIEEEEAEAIGDGVYPLPHRLNAVGNNVLCNDHGAVVHPGYDDEALAFMKEVLNVPVVRGTIAGIRTVGAAAVATNKGAVCHPHARPAEMDLLKTTLQVPVVITTANYGAAQVGACLVANSHGAVIGARTTSIEIGRIEEGLGLF